MSLNGLNVEYLKGIFLEAIQAMGEFCLAHIRLPTHQNLFFLKSYQNLVKWYGITHTVNPNKHKGGLSMLVVTNTGFTVLRHHQCVMQS